MVRIYNKLNFQKLTPTRIENMGYYNEALDFVFKDPDILNIAITGAYGAGKSSVIETYKGSHKEKKFIHISLTNFEKNNSEQNTGDIRENVNNIRDEDGKRLDEKELEGKILNQLIYQINPKNISQTKFKVKKDIKWINVTGKAITIFIFLISLLYIFKFKELKIAVENLGDDSIAEYLNILTKYSTFLVSIIVFFIIFIFYLYRIIKAQLYNPIFKKVKWRNNEIEVFENDEESYFNKHMDEILYLFRNSGVDAIVFEDIDRYDNNVIFSKLREINGLINNEINNKGSNKPIRFFYLIKDDIFTSKDRTKFFDFILPIIPVIDSSNSYDKLLEHFGQAGPLNSNEKTFLSELDVFFLRNISLYIDDMRLLKNIYNEYVIYYGRLQIIELDPNKLLALIIYKNIFPKDFIELQLNRGFVYSIFKNKDSYIREKKNEIDLQIKKKQEDIRAIKDELLNDLDELDALYLTTGTYNYRVNGKFDNQFNSRQEYIREMKEKDARVEEYIYQHQYRATDIMSKLNKFNDKPDYVKRKSLIEAKMNNGIEKIEKDIKILELEKGEISSLKMKDLIEKDYVDIDELFEHGLFDQDDDFLGYKDIINNHYYPLIKYLIRNGHIDETYFDYLGYFYENSLTRNDKIFLRSITDGDAKDYSYELKSPSKVITYLKPETLRQKEALNFDLLEYLLDNNLLNDNKEYLLCILQQIKHNKNFDFVWNYIVQASNVDRIVKELNIIWQELWVYLTSNDEIEDKKKKEYMIYTLHYSSLEDIENMNIENCITEYISTNENFLDIDNPNITKMIEAFVSLEISFENITYNTANKDLFKEVYNNNLYKLNFSMIGLILEKVYEIPYTSDYKEKNYTLISSQPGQPLKDYVDKNIGEYMQLLLSNITDKFRDSEDIVKDILNNSRIEYDDKLKYIQNSSTVIFDIEEIKDTDLWEEIFRSRVIDYSTKNILNYYFNYSRMMDPTITRYINDNPNKIKFERETIKENYGEDAHKFFIDVIKNNGLTNEKYEMILNGFNQTVNSPDAINVVNEDKFEILVKLNIVGMTRENISFVRSTYPDLMMHFIGNNIQNYIDCLDEETLIEQEILDLLSEDSISKENKTSLVNIFPNNISLESNDYDEDLQIYIIKNKFDNDDLKYLINNYSNSSIKMKQAIKEICIEHMEEISINEYDLPYDLLLELMPDDNIDDSYKKIITCNSINNLNGTQTKKLMSIAKFTDFESLFERGKPKIEITDENYVLLECFKGKRWITKYEKDKNDDGYYRAYGRDYSKIKKKALSDELL